MPSQKRSAKKRHHTTHGPSHKQVKVYSQPPIDWGVEKIHRQINGHLANAKRTITVTAIENTRGGLSLVTLAVLDESDLTVFQLLFSTMVEKSHPGSQIGVDISTSQVFP